MSEWDHAWGNRASCSRKAQSSGSLIKMYRVGLSKDKRHASVLMGKAVFQVNHCMEGLQQTPPIPVLIAAVAPVQVGGNRSISWRWVGLSDRPVRSFRQV